jgi:hypothetical protein
MNTMLSAGWPGFHIERRFPPAQIAEAHEYRETRPGSGLCVVVVHSSPFSDLSFAFAATPALSVIGMVFVLRAADHRLLLEQLL